MDIVGKIHSIETLGALDGEGLRTVFFLQGCGMRCRFCHNPDTWSFSAAAQEMTVKKLVDFALRYKNYYGENGGVTLSGGEPLAQEEFCIDVINLLHTHGINVAIDTGGSIFSPSVYDIADLIILDIKHTNATVFKELTGCDNTNLLKTLEYLRANKLKFWVRQVIVSGITDDLQQIKNLKAMAAGAAKIELLPYHTLGIAKWQSMGLEYLLSGIEPPSREQMRILNQILQTENL